MPVYAWRCCHESQTPLPPTAKAQHVLGEEYQSTTATARCPAALLINRLLRNVLLILLKKKWLPEQRKWLNIDAHPVNVKSQTPGNSSEILQCCSATHQGDAGYVPQQPGPAALLGSMSQREKVIESSKTKRREVTYGARSSQGGQAQPGQP